MSFKTTLQAPTMDERRLNRHLTDAGMKNPLVHNCPFKGRFNMGISRGNGAKPRLTLEIQ